MGNKDYIRLESLKPGDRVTLRLPKHEGDEYTNRKPVRREATVVKVWPHFVQFRMDTGCMISPNKSTAEQMLNGNTQRGYGYWNGRGGDSE